MSAQRHRWNRRKAMAALLAVSVLLLAAIAIAGQVLREQALATDFTRKNLPPSLAYPFGTDWMGRDMFVRSLTGLSISIRIGLLTACISAVVAFILGTMAACLGRATGLPWPGFSAGRSYSFVRASTYRLQRSWEREGFILPSNI